MINKKDYKILLPFFIVITGLVLFVSRNGFFWDTILLGSKQASFYYDNNFSSLLVPDTIDSPHPTLFSLYLALCWKWFGKTLLVSHLAILPFLLGIIYQVYLLLIKFIKRQYLPYALGLVLADATFLSQGTLMSPDNALLFFSLFSINQILKNKGKFWLSLSLMALSMISIRGMIAVAFLFFCELFLLLDKGKYKIKSLNFRQLLAIIISFLPVLLVTAAFFIYKYKTKGWIIDDPLYPWSRKVGTVDIKGFIFNTGVTLWRLIDFGRLYLWIAGIYLLFHYRKTKIPLDKNSILLFVFCCIFMVVISIFVVPFIPPVEHRSYMIAYLLFAIIISILISSSMLDELLKKGVFIILTLGLLSGNFWVYPDKIAKGWDSTLAHLPYYKLRHQMIEFMDQHKIPVEETGSAFPNLSTFELVDLNGQTRSFAELNLKTQKYIFQSNIYNEIRGKDLDELKSNWKVLKEYKCLQVYIRLYTK